MYFSSLHLLDLRKYEQFVCCYEIRFLQSLQRQRYYVTTVPPLEYVILAVSSVQFYCVCFYISPTQKALRDQFFVPLQLLVAQRHPLFNHFITIFNNSYYASIRLRSVGCGFRSLSNFISLVSDDFVHID